MTKEQAILKNLPKKIRKYFISDAVDFIVFLLKEDGIISDHTRTLITREGYSDVYTALAHQRNYGRNASYAAIVSEIKYAVKAVFEDLPDFALDFMKNECADPEKLRFRFCNTVLRNVLSLIGKDVTTAKKEEEKKLFEAEIPF